MADASIRSDASDGSAEGTPGEKQEIPKGHISARFRKFKDELLGHGAFKAVYKAFDLEEGREVAWNEIALEKLDSTEISKLSSEISLLREIKHDHIIRFFGSWVTPDAKELVFITECMSSGTLRQYIARRERGIPPRVVKNWCVQILTGLEFLHSLEPRVIHRDLKCDNVFINGSTGEVKIGDLGISRRLPEAHFAQTIVGTPEFMAPECFEGIYDEKADIWAFGQLVIEMCTRETPYHECGSSFKVYERIKGGQMPESFARVEHADLRDVIARCIRYRPEERPSARELLDMPVWADVPAPVPAPAELDIAVAPRECALAHSVALAAPLPQTNTPPRSPNGSPSRFPFLQSPGAADADASAGADADALELSDASTQSFTSQEDKAPPPGEPQAPFVAEVSGDGSRSTHQPLAVDVTLRLKLNDGTVHSIVFPFNVQEDLPGAVAAEMAEEFSGIFLARPEGIADEIQRIVKTVTNTPRKPEPVPEPTPDERPQANYNFWPTPPPSRE